MQSINVLPDWKIRLNTTFESLLEFKKRRSRKKKLETYRVQTSMILTPVGQIGFRLLGSRHEHIASFYSLSISFLAALIETAERMSFRLGLETSYHEERRRYHLDKTMLRTKIWRFPSNVRNLCLILGRSFYIIYISQRSSFYFSPIVISHSFPFYNYYHYRFGQFCVSLSQNVCPSMCIISAQHAV